MAEIVEDGSLCFEAVFFDPDRWDEIDTMADLSKTEKMFDGKCLGNPWITRIPKALGIAFPMLENHFFVLGADAS
jgi:hypothetical protein